MNQKKMHVSWLPGKLESDQSIVQKRCPLRLPLSLNRVPLPGCEFSYVWRGLGTEVLGEDATPVGG